MTRRNKQKKEVQDVNAFMHEVEEAMHAEQLSDFWKKYRTAIVGLSIVAFSGFAGFKYYNSSVENSLLEQSNSYYDVTHKINATADSYAELASANSEGVALLARFDQVKKLTSAGKREDAMLALDDIILNHKLPVSFRQLAQIYKSEIAMKTDVALARTTLENLVQGGTVYMSSALELLGYVYEKQGEVKRARAMYKEVVDMGAKAASGAAQRAQSRLNVLQAS